MIRKLPECVISRITAGEVVTSPSNALKELIENCLDAGATEVSVDLCSSLLSFSVADNGCGITETDLAVLCQNHYTSKITSLADLKTCGSIGAQATFGFRGEALHAIATSARVSVISRCRDEAFARRAIYSGADLVNTVKTARDLPGTTVEISDLFYHNEIRRAHFFKNRTESTVCLDLVKSYGCIHSGIGLSIDGKPVIIKNDVPKALIVNLAVKGAKGEDDASTLEAPCPGAPVGSLLCSVIGSSSDLRPTTLDKPDTSTNPEYMNKDILETIHHGDTPALPTFSKQPQCTEEDAGLPPRNTLIHETDWYEAKAKSIAVSQSAKLLDVQNDSIIRNKIKYIGELFLPSMSDTPDLAYRKENDFLLIASNRSLSLKNAKFILFINNRLVKSNGLRKKVLQKYKSYLKDRAYPFVYVEIWAEFADVNVHPSKSEVLLPESSIYERVAKAVDSILSDDTQFVHATYPQASSAEGTDSFDFSLPYNASSAADRPQETIASFHGDVCNYGNVSKVEPIPSQKEMIMDITGQGDTQACDQSTVSDNTNTTMNAHSNLQIDNQMNANVTDRPFVEASPVRSPCSSKRNTLNFEVSHSSPVKQYAAACTQSVEESIKKKRASLRVFSLESLQKLRAEVEETDTEFIRSLIYVGCTDSLIFAQAQFNLLAIDRRPFLRECTRAHLIQNFGNIDSRPIKPVQVAVDESLGTMLHDYFGIGLEDGHITEAPDIFGIHHTDWAEFSCIKTTELETFRAVIDRVADIYQNAVIDTKIFNTIKRTVNGTERIIACCQVIVAVKDLYKKFGRC